MACIFGSAALSHKQQAGLITSYVALERSYDKYKCKIIEIFGEDADKQVREEMAKDPVKSEYPTPEENECLFYDENYVSDDGVEGKYFTDTLLHVCDCEYELNRYFALRGCAELNQFYEIMEHEELPPNKHGAMVGWSDYIGETTYGYHWIDFKHEHVTLDDGMECIIIHTPFAPHADFDW